MSDKSGINILSDLEMHCMVVAEAAARALTSSASHDGIRVEAVDVPSAAAAAGHAEAERAFVGATTDEWTAAGASFASAPGMSTTPILLPYGSWDTSSSESSDAPLSQAAPVSTIAAPSPSRPFASSK